MRGAAGLRSRSSSRVRAIASTLPIFARHSRNPFAYRRPDPPQYGAGGDAFLESTPAVLPLALGVARIRAHSLAQQQRLVALLAERAIAASGGTDDRGAFITVVDERAEPWSD